MTRMFTEKIMPSVINGNGPVEFVTFHTDATTHKELDDGRNLSNKFLMKLHLGMEEYIDNYRENPVLGWANLGALAQKIGIEDPNKLA